MALDKHTRRNPEDKKQYHLVLLARNITGYRNLVWLVTRAHLDGFYYKARIDRELLADHHEGVIALSAC
jgi:DNA polymerase-3 subunit alpha